MMNKIITAALLGLAAVSSAQDVDANARLPYKSIDSRFQLKSIKAENTSTSACPAPGGAHIIVARASTEAPGFGVIGQVKDMVLSRVAGSTAEAVVYPATLTDYINSEDDGVVAMKQLVANFVAKCKGSPLVLMGYSQGAQVTADTLVGQDVNGFYTNASISSALPTDTINRIAAGIMMGDPTFTTTESNFHVGNATQDGIFPRHNVPLFNSTGLAPKLKTYCNAGDPYCASGSFKDIIVHLTYVPLFGKDAADFTVSQIKSWYQQNGGGFNASGTTNSSSTSSPSPSSTPAPSTGAGATVGSSVITTMISLALTGAFAMML